MKQSDDIIRPAPERAKRRHARPHVLDSDDDEDDEKKEEDKALQDEETMSDKVEAIVPADDDPQILVFYFIFYLFVYLKGTMHINEHQYVK